MTTDPQEFNASESVKFRVPCYSRSIGKPASVQLRGIFILRNCLATLALVSMAYQAHAQDVANWDFATTQKRACASGNMTEMNECMATAYAEADRQMNKIYTELQTALLKPAPLKRAQLAWLRFRDAECEFQAPKESQGSEAPYSMNACLIDLTAKRTLDLTQITPCNGCVEFKPDRYKLR